MNGATAAETSSRVSASGERLVGVRDDAQQPVDGHHVLALDAGDASRLSQYVEARDQGRGTQVESQPDRRW
jgi:hypothetical protein